MSYYDNDYTDDMYDRYMHTGEGAEYFEDRAEEYPDEYMEEVETEKIVEYKDTNEMLDDTIRYLKLQIKEKERIIKEQKRIERKRKAQAKKKSKRTKNTITETPHTDKQTLSYNTKFVIGCFLFVLNIILLWFVLTM